MRPSDILIGSLIATGYTRLVVKLEPLEFDNPD